MNGRDHSRRVVGLCGSAIFLVGCYSGLDGPRELGPTDRTVEIAFPEQEGEPAQGLFHIGDELQEIHYEIKNGLAIHQGDIVLGRIEDLSPAQRGEDGVTEAAVKPDMLWHDGVVPYVFDDGLPQAARDAFLAAVAHWEQNTVLRFVPHQGQGDYIRVVHQSGCWSFIGRTGGEQLLSIGPGCETLGVAAHEIGHAIGFYHEQSRSDRDANVVVHWDNIEAGYEDNFFTYAEQGAVGEDVGVYNVESIMHYPSWAFSIDPQSLPTITRLDGSWFESNRERLTSTDLEGAARLYGSPQPGDDCGVLWPGQWLGRGGSRASCDGRFTLVMQDDGNVVLYQNGVGALWHTSTHGTRASSAVMQEDGNFVVYDDAGTPLWHTGTHRNDGSVLVVQDDGNLVIYSPAGGALWASHTCCR
jgi:hypothetical protein